MARYRYNAHGQRVAKTVYAASAPVGGTASSKSESAAQTTTTTYYLWSEGKLVAEIEGSGKHRGEIGTQYLYLGSQGRFAPIAKLEAAWTQGNTTAEPRTLYVHAGHRGEPTAMTDERARVVWKARPDAWGFVQASVQPEKTSDPNPSSPADATPDSTRAATMNLRLPGQYFDAETGLHDNVHRSYDPRPGSPNKGRYLTPDPLGYPDGDDPYAYVAGDPVNRIDPLGLHQEDIHYYMTFFLALAAGVPYDTARTIALADQYVDDDPRHPAGRREHLPLVTSSSTTLVVLWNQEQLLELPLRAVVTTTTAGAVGLLDTSHYGSTPDGRRLRQPGQRSARPALRATRCFKRPATAPNINSSASTCMPSKTPTAHRRLEQHSPTTRMEWGLGIGHGGDRQRARLHL